MIRTPLHLACGCGRLNAVSFLLGTDCTINICDRWGATPLDECVKGATSYHVFCGKLVQGLGGVLSLFEGSQEGQEFLARMKAISIDEIVAKRRKIGRAAASVGQRIMVDRSKKSWVTVDELRIAKSSEHESQVSFESCMHLIAKLIAPIEKTLVSNIEMLESCQKLFDAVEDRVKQFLYELARAMDSAGLSAPALHVALYSASDSSTAVSLSHVGNKFLRRVDTFYESLSSKTFDESQSDLLLASVLDEETLQLYEEADRIAREAEMMGFRSTHGYHRLAQAFDRCIMHVNDVSDFYGVLDGAFGSHSQRKSALDLCQIVDLLGIHISEEQATDMIIETGQRESATLDDLLCGSAEFRALLMGVDGTYVSEGTLGSTTWKYLKDCSVLRTLPISWMLRAQKKMTCTHHAKDSTILAAGSETDYLFFVQKGELTLKNCEGKVIGNVKQCESFCMLEFFLGTGLGYSVEAATDVSVLGLSKTFVATAFGRNGQYLANAADALIEHVDRMAMQSEEGFIEGFSIPMGLSRLDYRNAFLHRLADRFVPGLDPDAVEHLKREIELARDIFPGIDVISNCWASFADSEETLNLKDLLGLRGKTGEVGDKFLVTFSNKMYTVLHQKIQRDHDDLDAGDSSGEKAAVIRLLDILFEHSIADESPEGEVNDVDFRISLKEWWQAWILFLNGSESSEEPSGQQVVKHASKQDAYQNKPAVSGQVALHEDEDEMLDIGILAAAWSYLTFSRITSLLLHSETLDRYEAAYVMTIGNLHDKMHLEYIPMLIRFLLPRRSIVTKVNIGEFVMLFGDDGMESTYVTWNGIRKVVRERARELASRNKKEPFFIENSGRVFNLNSTAMRGWNRWVRAVAVYHFLAVPVRITFRPFSSLSDPYLLCTDLVADAMILLYMLVKMNTAYINKKSKLCYDRYKILKHYFGKGSCVLDIMIVFPIDWICLAFGVSFERAQWMRILKMFFVKSTKKSSHGNSGVGLKALATTAALEMHLGAVVWAFLGYLHQDTVQSLALGTTWYQAESAQKFLSGVSMDGYDSPSSWEMYVQTLNWVSTHTVSTVGNATLCPKNYVEIGFAILLMTIGMTFYKTFLGKLSAFIMQKDQHIINVRGDLSALDNYIKHNRLDEDQDLVAEIYKNFELKNDPNTVDAAEIFDNLSSSLRFELATLLCSNMLDHCELFKGCSDDVLDGLGTALREISFDPEEILFHFGGVADEMYLISMGTVLLEESEDEGMSAKVLRKGSAVGDVSFAFGTKHIYTARAGAGTGATCWKLSRKSYLSILKRFPDDHEVVTSNSLKSFEAAKGMGTMSRKSRSIKGQEDVQSASERGKEADERSIPSDGGSSHVSTDHSDDLGPGGGAFSAQIQALKRHQKNTMTQQFLNAAFSGDIQKIRKLQTRWVRVNDMDESGRTALHVASSEGKEEVVRFLLECKADATLKDRHQNTPLNDAVRHKHDVVAACIRDFMPNAKVVLPGCMAAVKLLDAAFHGDLEQVQRLVNNGIEVNTADYDKRTALHLAACEGHKPVVEFLLKAKANPAARDRFGGTALHDSVRHERSSVQQLLKDAGCQMSDVAVKLCKNAASGNLDKIKNLVSNRVDPNLCDADGRTALHLACSNSCIDVINYLLHLSARINVNPVDRTGSTPLDDAVRHRHTIAAEMLRQSGGLQRGCAEISELMREQESTMAIKRRLERRPAVQEKAFDSQEFVWFEGFQKKFAAAFDSHVSELSTAGSSPGDGGDTEAGQTSEQFVALTLKLTPLLNALSVALSDTAKYVESHSSEGIPAMVRTTGSESGHMYKRWGSVKSLIKVTHQRRAETELQRLARLADSVLHAVNEMLVLLVQMYHTVPELGDNAPKAYHLLGARYSTCRSIFQQRILTCASVLQELSTWVRRDASALTHLFPCLHACFNLT